MHVVVNVDGGARGNPGPAAAAAVAASPGGEVLGERSVVLGRATNNEAEYRGLLLGLELARDLGATEVDVINDSELVARQVTGRYKVKKRDLVPLHREATRALEGFRRWSLRPVPRAQNAAADALVNRALDAREDGDPARAEEPAASGAADDSGETDYAGYLRIHDLLRLQRPITPEAHDEMLFIVVHQSYELWFKLIVHELEKARSELEGGRPQAAVGPLKRTVAVDRLLLEHLSVLETMSPDGFLEFRDPLAPASGFQSQQFRAIEAGSPRLYEALAACASFPEDREERLRALAELYRDHLDDPRRAALHAVAELLVDHDESIARWRHHHTLMAAREIGTRPGTGGSRGVEYLRSTQDRRFYPELWDVRATL